MGTVRRVCSNIKRWQDAAMALRWTPAAMLEAVKGSAGSGLQTTLGTADGPGSSPSHARRQQCR
jgi:hypothetical protein